MNILNLIRNLIVNDEKLKAIVGNRVYFYETTENTDTSDTFVVLTPINTEPSTFVSDMYRSETFFVQVDVESYKEETTLITTNRIRYLLFQNDLKPSSSQLDDYFKETKRYVKSRRYLGTPKNQYYKGEHIE